MGVLGRIFFESLHKIACFSIARDRQPRGVELFGNSRGNRPHQVTGGAKSGAVAGAVNSPATLLDVNLLRIIQSWPALSQNTRQQIMRVLDD